MSKFEKNYSPAYEAEIYRKWETGGYFKPLEDTSKGTFTIILPPPNANGTLHLGHALFTVEDVLIRFNRMLGKSTLWLPGTDHAGFETQVVYEKHLEKQGKSRFDFSREDLYKNIYDFVMSQRHIMQNQLRLMGFSLDWSRERFTLEESIIKTVYSTFKRLHEDGYLYRDSRLVNYCTKHGTGFSDLEILYEKRSSKIYFVKFLIKDSAESITVATTRPETIPGDVAIAVNPSDKRFEKYIGKIVINPFSQREMPIIGDDYVDSKFGTGALKITPAHDTNDFEIAKRHNLPLVQVINKDGRLNENASEILKGLKVIPAREKAIEFLSKKGLVEKIKDHSHIVGTCYKCGTVLEPLPVPQWYIKTKDFAEAALIAVKEKRIKIYPKKFEKQYFNWLENIKDWNISRQIVWGIRIPAWECQDCKEWIITKGQTPSKCTRCGSSNLVQDPDTFDTWFSSGQWPFATLNYPDGDDFKKFYPTTVLETAYDILFYWVARMVMLGIYVTEEVPFKNIYLHGIVRDSKGQKMSKSKGNVINPLDLVEKYGADPIRMALITGASAGIDQNFNESRIVGYRNFANKIWNMAKFIEFFQESENIQLRVFDSYNQVLRHSLTEQDIQIIEVSQNTIKEVTKNLSSYQLNIAAEKVYHFIWHEIADKYIEFVKVSPNKGLSLSILNFVFMDSLKLLHPFMPFVTEAVWQRTNLSNESMLITAPWPKST